MSIWDVLGIEATSDTSIIRKAYARRLRIHHPEEDPEGYQHLREAYDAALKQAPQLTPEKLPEEADNGAIEEQHTPMNTAALHKDLAAMVMEEAADPIHLFIAELDNIYQDFSLRLDSEAWKQLLNHDVIWNVERSKELQYALVSYLEDHHYLPKSIWQQLDTLFHLQEDRENLLDDFDDAFVEYIVIQIQGMTELRYDCFARNPIAEQDAEHYLHLRERAQDLLMHNEPLAAADYLNAAHVIYPHDPDLQLMRGQCHLMQDEDTAALACFSAAIMLGPEDHEGYWYRAQILFTQQDYSAALTDVNHILAADPKHTDALSLKGRSLLELGQIDQARETLKASNQQDIYHIHSYMYINSAGNRHRYGKAHVPPAEKRRVLRNGILFDTMMVLRLSWLYILIYVVLQLFFDVHLIYTGLFAAVLLWNTWKTIRAHRVLIT